MRGFRVNLAVSINVFSSYAHARTTPFARVISREIKNPTLFGSMKHRPDNCSNQKA
ncbi:hypothetical protein PF008_g8010 [Phytophthora fragariae]|uniref:Uncharacterized protein n=1 Tax=Phytophthora fragariae TaxID=53985 RepID=A0A6G0S1C8_9STRA|nr:hypothetical protein PF008_g8010 [Phytophthora fragariae]